MLWHILTIVGLVLACWFPLTLTAMVVFRKAILRKAFQAQTRPPTKRGAP